MEMLMPDIIELVSENIDVEGDDNPVGMLARPIQAGDDDEDDYGEENDDNYAEEKDAEDLGQVLKTLSSGLNKFSDSLNNQFSFISSKFWNSIVHA